MCLQLCYQKKINDIHQWEDTDHVCAIVRTSPRATHVVRAGDLTPKGTMLVTPDLDLIATRKFLPCGKSPAPVIAMGRWLVWHERKRAPWAF